MTLNKAETDLYLSLSLALQLSRSIEEGFIKSAASTDDLLVISDDPKELVDKLCSKWKEVMAKDGFGSTIADEAV